MNTNRLLIVLGIFLPFIFVCSQTKDSLFIKSYPQRFRLMGYAGTSFIQIADGEKNYTPNYPLSAGVGFAVKNTIIGIQGGYGIISLKNKETYGRSKMLDFQLHNYSRKAIFDVFLQRYKGFYSEKKIGTVDEILPDMSVTQIGGEATYLFGGDRLSSKAAFDLNEIQLRSAGSWLLGGGAYYYRINGLPHEALQDSEQFENIQLGINGGYAYSWVVNDRWMISAMAKAGANFGNTPNLLKNGKIEVYPTAFARFAGNYHKKDWGISMAVMISNKSVYPITNSELSITTVTMQLSYVRHLDHLFKRK